MTVSLAARVQHIRAALAERFADERWTGWELVEGDREWEEQHPAGFGGPSLATVGETILYSPTIMAATTRAYDDGDVDRYLDAVEAWWQFSMVHFMLQLPADLIAGMFAQDRADDHLVLTQVAGERGIVDEQRWVR